jgi:hypothetical protein
LRDESPSDSLHRRYEEFSVELSAGQRVSISSDAEAFDPFLELYRTGSSQVLAEDDDSGPGFNALLTYTPPESGAYTIRILSFLPDGRGPFRVRISPVVSLPPVVSAMTGATPMVWQEAQGELTRPQTFFARGLFVDHLISAAANEEILIRADSDQFDTVIEVFPADARDGEPIAADDDGGFGTNSLVVFRPSSGGDYVVRVRSYNDRVGAYRLRVGRFTQNRAD